MMPPFDALADRVGRSVELTTLVAFGFLMEWLVPEPWAWVTRIAVLVWFASIMHAALGDRPDAQARSRS